MQFSETTQQEALGHFCARSPLSQCARFAVLDREKTET